MIRLFNGHDEINIWIKNRLTCYELKHGGR